VKDVTSVCEIASCHTLNKWEGKGERLSDSEGASRATEIYHREAMAFRASLG